MERKLLKALDFRLSTPEPSWFLRMGVDACSDLTDEAKDRTLLRCLYVLDLLMMDETWPTIAPSFAAAASIALILEIEEGWLTPPPEIANSAVRGGMELSSNSSRCCTALENVPRIPRFSL